MDIKELENFKLSDAIKFHKTLNPVIWTENDKLDSEVRNQLLLIAEDFVTHLGIKNLDVADVTVSGSNAAYTYTPYSDLDLHILVDFDKLEMSDVYQELFTAKKNEYNDNLDISVRGIPVELYVQNVNQPHASLGEYSVLHDKWLKFPRKEKINFNEKTVKLKYERLGQMIESAIKSDDYDKVVKAIDILKRYRKAGLDQHGEFGSENLAFKALRNSGYVQRLYDHRNKLRSKKLSIDEENNAGMDLEKLINLYGQEKILKQLDIGIKSELSNTNDVKKAFQIVINNLFKNPKYYTRTKNVEDYDPNGPPPGPEFPPTMPAGTVKVDVSDVYDWYKLGQHISNMKGLGKHDFGKGPPSTILSFGDEDTEHKYIQDLMKTGLTTTDIDPKGHEPMKGQKVDPTYNVNEILDKESASNLSWNEGESNELYNTYIATAKDKKDNILKYNFYEFPKYDLTAIEFSRAVGPWGDNYSIDKAGEQYTVFATLLQAIKNYLSSDKPEYIFFAAKEPSRVKLYQSFVNRFANQFGYKQISADSIPKAVSFTLYSSNDTPFLLQKVDSIKEASGYIPSEKEKNDPRFKTALTVDVKSDSIKKNAKAFGWKISRAGIPPLLRK